MKQRLVLLFALILSYSLSAQNKIYEEAIGWRGKNIELHTISDRDKQENAVFLMNFDSIRIFLLDNTATVIRQIRLRRDLGEKLLGGFIREGKLSIFMHIEHGEPHMHGWTFDLQTGSGEEYYIPFAMGEEKMGERISAGDHFLCFAANKKTGQLVLYDFRDGKHYDSLHYRFPTDGIWKDLTKSAGISRDLNVAKFDQEGESSPDNANKPNKLYLIGDTLYLLMNVAVGVTGIFHFDLVNRQVAYREIIENEVGNTGPVPAGYADNFYLLDGKLYFVSVTPDTLTVQVRDFFSGALMRQYIVGSQDTISFKNTPIIQEENDKDGRDKTTRELTKTRQLMRRMLNGKAVIMADEQDSGRLALSVGSFLSSGRQWGSGGGGGGGMWTGSPVTGMTYSYMPSGGFYRLRAWTKSARFKMLLDSATLTHLEGDMPMSINDKIETYTEGTPIPPEGENLFRNNGSYIYGYYDRDDHKIILVKF